MMKSQKSPEILLIGNEKGGVGKTATAACLSNALTALGYKVLVVDLDPSGNFSDAALPSFPKNVLYDVMSGKCHVSEAIVHTDICDVLPTIKDITPENDTPFMAAGMPERKSLGDLFASWVGRRGSEKCMYNLLRNPLFEDVFGKYDFILLDSPPSDSLITTNAILSATNILFPCEPVSGALDGLTKFIKSIQLTRDAYGAKACIDGLVFAKYSESWKTRQSLISQIEANAKSLGIHVYKTRFRISASIETAMNNCKPILHPDYMYMGWGASDAMNFALEFLARRNLAPRVNYPGVIRDEHGNLIFRRKGDTVYTVSRDNLTITVGTKRFRFEDVGEGSDLVVGQTLFFHPESIQENVKEAHRLGMSVLATDKNLGPLIQPSESA